MTSSRLQAAAILILLLLTACAGSRTAKPAKEPEPDPATQTLSRAAALAYRTGRYEQAATLYRETLKSAMERDLWREIIDARFNLALTATAQGQYQVANGQLELAEAEHQRHNQQPDLQIALLRATVDYRRGDLSASLAIARRLIEDQRSSPDVRRRAIFIAALIAADQNNIPGLREYIAELESAISNNSGVSINLLELKGRLHGLDGDLESAKAVFDEAIEQRRVEQDYRGMVRALASCARALEEGLPAEAADYYLRAGRSAAQRRDPQARQWLLRASELGADDTFLLRETKQLLLLLE